MTDRHALMQALKANIDQLAYPYSHTEVVELEPPGRPPHRYRHITKHQPLIQQLAMHAKDDDGQGTPGGRPVYDSSPPAALHAIDRHHAIRSACEAWLRAMGVRRRATLVDNLRALPGAASRLDVVRLEELVGTVRAWWCWARTVTGWDDPPYQPWGPCPVCEWIGSLRVRSRPRTAVCVECWTHWDSYGVDELGAYIRLWAATQETVP